MTDKAALPDDVEALKALILELQANPGEVPDTSTLRASIEAAKKDAAARQQELDERQAEITALNAVIERQDQDLVEKEAEIQRQSSDLERQRAELAAHDKAMDQRVRRLEAELADLLNESRKRQADMARSEAENTQKDSVITDLRAEAKKRDDYVAHLEYLLKSLRQAQYGHKSEKIDADQFQLALEDIETDIAKTSAQVEDDLPPDLVPKPKRKINRGALPKHLPRIEQVIEPDTVICDCGSERHIIGEDVTERLDVIPARFQVIVTRRPKYACRSCEEKIIQAPAPAHLITGGLPTEATIASVIISKYADHLPLYRQVEMYKREGVVLDRSTLADWVGRAAFELRPIYAAMLQDLKSSSKLFMDETSAPVLDPGRGKTKQGYFWALARDDRPWQGTSPPGVCFTYASGRAGAYAKTILGGFSGVLQVDGYAGYNQLLKSTPSTIELAHCWAHARRKLYELTCGTVAAPIAEAGLQQIQKLYIIEDKIRGQSAQQRLQIRQTKTKPLIEVFKLWLDRERAQVSAKSPTGQALKYIARHWQGLTKFLDDGRIEMDNNTVERTIRPIALNRKNALFAGHEAGAQNWAMLASLIETCKLNSLNPHSYIEHVLTALVAEHKQSDIEQLLPWNVEL